MTKITIIGTGYVGLVSGTCLAEIGHDVICCDISNEKIDMLNKGEISIYEVGLKELVDKNVSEKRLFFTSDVDSAIREADVVFNAVGTPPDENNKVDMRFVHSAAKSFAKNLNRYKIFVNKSTVPVGTGDAVKEIINQNREEDIEFDVVSNPEFLREGAAVKDFLNPERIIIGCSSDKVKEIMEIIYRPLVRTSRPLIITDIRSAELIKYAANSFLATKISFMNEIANYCELIGANIKEVTKGLGYDSRIGSKFLSAGVGYGGSCFPKDVSALYESGIENGYDFKIIRAVREINSNQRLRVIQKLNRIFGNELTGKTVCIWGLSFKPRTDDVRESPAYYIIEELNKSNVGVNAYDPVSTENFRQTYEKLDVQYFNDKYEAAKDCDALVIVTEWDEFRTIDFDKLQENMKGNILIDGRNILLKKDFDKINMRYFGIGV